MATRRDEGLPSHPGGDQTFPRVTAPSPEAGIPPIDDVLLDDGAVDEDAIQDDAVTTPKIPDAAIITAKINDGAVATAKLANEAVTSGKIGSSAVLTDKINDAAVETAKLADDAVTADKIIARAIGAQHLFVGSFDNLVRNPSFEQEDATGEAAEWYEQNAAGGNWIFPATQPRSGGNALAFDTASQSGSNARLYNTNRDDPFTDGVAVQESDEVYAQCWVRDNTGSGNGVQIVLRWHDEDGVLVSQDGGSTVVPGTTYELLTIAAAAPANATQVFAGVVIDDDGNSSILRFDDFYMRRMVEGSIVVDGTITTDHLEADSITSAKIAANAIEAEHISTRSVGAQHLFVGSFDNLIRNPGFEQDLDEWSAVSSAGGSWALYSSNPRSGGQHLGYDATNQTGSNALFRNSTSNTDGVAVAEGDTLYAEAYVREATAGAFNRVRIQIRWRDESGAGLGWEFGSEVSVGDSYERISVSGSAPAGVAFAELELQVSGDGNGGLFFFDDAYMRRMVEGSIVVDGTITADHLTVSTLSAITADLGTVTAGTLQANVVVASSTFTAATPTFEGDVRIEGGNGSKLFEFTAVADGGQLEIHDTGGTEQGSLGYDGVGGDYIYLQSTHGADLYLGADDDLILDIDGDIVSSSSLLFDVTGAIELDASGDLTLTSGTDIFIIDTLPTSDPAVSGALWNDGGFVKVSSG